MKNFFLSHEAVNCVSNSNFKRMKKYKLTIQQHKSLQETITYSLKSGSCSRSKLSSSNSFSVSASESLSPPSLFC